MLTKFSVSRRKIVIAGRAIGTLGTEGSPKVPIKSPKTPQWRAIVRWRIRKCWATFGYQFDPSSWSKLSELLRLNQGQYVMFVKKYFVHGLATGVLLSIVSALYSLENRLVTEVFPREKPSIHSPDKPHFEGLKQRTMQFFGIDADAGQIGILEIFGRPQRAYLAPPYDWGVPMPSGRISRICTYTYPGLTISFDNGLLLRIDVTRPQWNFRLPIRVGDPEQRVYELFGKPGWQYECDGMRQIDYALTGRLSVYIREGKVSRIIWGVG